MDRSDTEHKAEHIDEMLDNIIKNYITEANAAPQRQDPLVAAIADGALVAMSRLAISASEVERALLAEILAARIAQTLAPALAQALAPEVLTALSKAEPGHDPGVRQ